MRIRADAYIVTQVRDGAAGSIAVLLDAGLCLHEGWRYGKPEAYEQNRRAARCHGMPP
jgi:hypothetical protein